jgi:hypothetical protein
MARKEHLTYSCMLKTYHQYHLHADMLSEHAMDAPLDAMSPKGLMHEGSCQLAKLKYHHRLF